MRKYVLIFVNMYAYILFEEKIMCVRKNLSKSVNIISFRYKNACARMRVNM